MKLNLKTKKCLIIEDLPNVRKAIREMLYTLDVQMITETASGLGAIATMSKEHFDIVLCDYNLGPGKNGQQVLEEAKFRKLLPYSAIFIMVTAEQTPGMVLGAMENKPDEYLTKPFNAQQLLTRLQRNHARKQYLFEIEQALETGNLAKAISRCDAKLLDDNRKMHPHLLKIRAQLAIDTGDFKKATELYQSILAQRDLTWARLGLGIIAYRQQRFQAAIEIFQKIIEQAPLFLDARDWLAQCHEAEGNYSTAQTILNQATQISPQAILRQRKLAGLADKTGNLEIAEQAYKNVVELGNYSIHKAAGDFSGLAKIYAKTNYKEAALKVLQDMRTLYVNNPEAELRAATLETLLYEQLDIEPKSKQAYETAQRLNQKLGDQVPDDLRLDLAHTCYKKGDQELANQLVDQLIMNNIDDDHFIYDIRNMLKQAGQADRSEALIKSIKQNLVEINNKGVELFRKGNLSEALKVLTEAAKKMPNNRTIITNMAKILLHELKTTGVTKEKFLLTQSIIKKAAVLGVAQDKIGNMQIQLEKLMINKTSHQND